MPLPERFSRTLAGEEVLAWAPLDLAPDGPFKEGLLALLPAHLVRLAPGGARIAARHGLAGLGALALSERDGWIALSAGGAELARATVAQLEARALIADRSRLDPESRAVLESAPTTASCRASWPSSR